MCSGISGDCRTNAPRISTMDSQGGECIVEQGRIGDLGSKTFTTPYNVVYQRPGVTVREFNHAGLRLPQKREFLGPEFFNSGCATLYGNSRFGGGPSSATESSQTEAMFDYNFAPHSYFEGNDADCSCTLAKCNSLPNTAQGWMLNKNGDLLWQAAERNAAQPRCGMNN